MVLFSLNNFNAVIAFLVVVTEKSIAKINIILKEQNCIPQIQPEHKIYVLFIKKIQSKEKFCILHPMKPCLSGSEGRKNRKSENKETTENQKKKIENWGASKCKFCPVTNLTDPNVSEQYQRKIEKQNINLID